MHAQGQPPRSCQVQQRDPAAEVGVGEVGLAGCGTLNEALEQRECGQQEALCAGQLSAAAHRCRAAPQRHQLHRSHERHNTCKVQTTALPRLQKQGSAGASERMRGGRRTLQKVIAALLCNGGTAVLRRELSQQRTPYKVEEHQVEDIRTL